MGEICPFIELRAFFIDRRRYYDRKNVTNAKEAKGEILIKADGQVLIKAAVEEHLLENAARKGESICCRSPISIRILYRLSFRNKDGWIKKGELSICKIQLQQEKKTGYNTHEILHTIYTHITYKVRKSIFPHTSIDHIQQTLHPCSTLPSHIHP